MTEVKEKKKIVKRAPKTLKEKRFVKEYLKTGNATQSALKVYDTESEHSAAQIGHEKLRKLDMSYHFYSAGLTNEVMAQNTARIALTATKRDQFSGEMYDDNKMQLDGMRFAADLMGLTKKDEATPANNYFQFIQNQTNGFGLPEIH